MQQIAGRGSQTEGHGSSGGGQPGFQDRGAQWQRPQRSIESPEATFSTPVQNGSNLLAVAQSAPYEGPAAGPQRNASQAPVGGGAGNQSNARNAHTPTPSGPGPVNGNSGQAPLSAKGPVEFNHAISYVNKIKVSSIEFGAGDASSTEANHYLRTVFRTNRRFTNNSSKFCKRTRGNRNLSKMSMRRLRPCSTRHRICWNRSSSSSQSLPDKQTKPLPGVAKMGWAAQELHSPEMDRRCRL